MQDPASVAAAVTTIGDAFGKLDILVNNAGALETWTPLGASDPAAWWNTWDISIRATYDVTRQALPLLVQSAQKTVVNVASGGAHLVLPGASAYQTAKFAQLRLTEFLCRDHAADGLLAYAVHPGAIGTELSLRTPEYMHACEFGGGVFLLFLPFCASVLLEPGLRNSVASVESVRVLDPRLTRANP